MPRRSAAVQPLGAGGRSPPPAGWPGGCAAWGRGGGRVSSGSGAAARCLAPRRAPRPRAGPPRGVQRAVHAALDPPAPPTAAAAPAPGAPGRGGRPFAPAVRVLAFRALKRVYIGTRSRSCLFEARAPQGGAAVCHAGWGAGGSRVTRARGAALDRFGVPGRTSDAFDHSPCQAGPAPRSAAAVKLTVSQTASCSHAVLVGRTRCCRRSRATWPPRRRRRCARAARSRRARARASRHARRGSTRGATPSRACPPLAAASTCATSWATGTGTWWWQTPTASSRRAAQREGAGGGARRSPSATAQQLRARCRRRRAAPAPRRCAHHPSATAATAPPPPGLEGHAARVGAAPARRPCRAHELPARRGAAALARARRRRGPARVHVPRAEAILQIHAAAGAGEHGGGACVVRGGRSSGVRAGRTGDGSCCRAAHGSGRHSREGGTHRRRHPCPPHRARALGRSWTRACSPPRRAARRWPHCAGAAARASRTALRSCWPRPRRRARRARRRTWRSRGGARWAG
jgi:hypothetical protein